jgi:formylglycine-generating enzyme required for sulfatase activity
MGAYEVTQAEYENLMGKNPSYCSPGGGGNDKVAGLNTRRFPVENVSWDDAMAFCKELSERESKNYDLPTEAEWEYACRAGTTTPFHFGEALNGRQANCNGNEPHGTDVKGPHLGRTCEVGSYSPNKFGLYDMHGNVWEFCKDWYSDDYYGISHNNDPQGPNSGLLHVMRGGSWYEIARLCRSAFRSWPSTGNRDINTGFRVVLRLP